MGADCDVELPPYVRIQDVGDVLSIASGGDWTMRTLDWGHYVKTDAQLIHTHTPEMVIILLPKTIDREFGGLNGAHEAHYFFESEKKAGWKTIILRSTAFWIPVAMRLVDFFGGSVDFNDNDSIAVDYSQPAKYKRSPSKGNAWDQFQAAKAEVTPISLKDMKAADQLKGCAYKMKGNY